MRSSYWIEKQLEQLKEEDQLRKLTVLTTVADRQKLQLINFSSNDYLNLSHSPELLSALNGISSLGTCAARLTSGTNHSHLALESELASWLGHQDTLLFGSGYLCNLGVISSLAGRGDVIFADRYVHASLIDGMVLSRAKIRRYRHNDVSSLERLTSEESKHRKARTKFLIITESVFSMDGDQAPLEDIARIAQRFDCLLLVDEAHAIGVFGRHGSGLLTRAIRDGILITASLSKSLGSYGGFVACPSIFKQYFINTARSFIYNTALPECLVEGARAAVRLLTARDGLGDELLKKATVFRKLLQAGGLNVLESSSQIVPILVGNSSIAVALAERLYRRGIIASAIRSPTVPLGSERLRLSVTLAHSLEDLNYAADVISEEYRGMGLR